MFCASVSVLLFALIDAGKRGSIWEPDLLALFAISVALLLVFLRWERKAEEPVIPILLFRNPVFRACCGIGLLAGMGLFGSISFIPLFVQGVFFGSATQAGSALTPLLLGWTALSIVSGPLLLRSSYRPLVIAGMASFAVGFLALTRLSSNSTYFELLPPMAVLGIGMGLSMVTMMLAVQSTVPRKLLGIATSAQLFFRTIGGAIGVAIMGSVMGHRMTARLDGTTDPMLARLAANPDSIVSEAARQSLSPEATAWLRDALAASLHGVFVTGLVIALLAFALALRFPRGTPQELAERLDPPTG
jgi:MFS family permease